MEIFSEIYSCYYQVLRHLLCRKDAVTIQDICTQIHKEGFEESFLSILPKLENNTWKLFQKNGELYLSRISPSFLMPLSSLQKSYLKALLSDSRIRLFLDEKQLEALDQMLACVPPLWKTEQLSYYDRFLDGDPYDDKIYRSNFRTLLEAAKNSRYVDIDYTTPDGNRVRHYYVPARLEYSVKNDKFRLLALKHSKNGRLKLETLNLSRMKNVRLTEKLLLASVNINTIIRNSYYKEPLTLHLINRRNALERAMLHFANYEKNTTKIDENTYECLIYYNKNMETELLIEVLSFGPMLTVIGNDRFLKNLKMRLKMQMDITQQGFLN